MEITSALRNLYGEKVLALFKRGFLIGYLERQQNEWVVRADNDWGIVYFETEDVESLDEESHEIVIKN